MLFQERQRQIEVQRRHVTSLGGEVRAILESELNASLHLTSGLITYIQARQGKLQASEIDPWLSGLIKQGRHIRNIGIAPGNRITYIYPLAGNEAALGLYYPDNAKQWPAVEQVIRGRHPVLAGPITQAGWLWINLSRSHLSQTGSILGHHQHGDQRGAIVRNSGCSCSCT